MSMPFTAGSTSSTEIWKRATRCATRVGIMRAVQLLPASKYSTVMPEACARIGWCKCGGITGRAWGDGFVELETETREYWIINI